MEERKSFSFRREYLDVALLFKTKRRRCEFYEAVCKYALRGEWTFVLRPGDPDLAIAEVKTLIDADRRSAEEVRRSTEYKEWRRNVFARDDYTCQRCGARGVKINAHHIKHFATDPDLRLELSNGITLCVTCHKAVHHGA